MKLFRTTWGYIYRRPLILWFPALIMLLVCAADIYNPLSSLILGLSSLTGGSIADSIISMLQILLDPAYLPLAAGLAVVFVIIASLAGGLLFSGYFNVLYSAAAGKPKARGEFSFGIKKYFLKLTGVNFLVLLIGAALAVFLLVSLVPAAVAGRAAMSGRVEFTAAAVFIAALTVVVIFFIIMFYRSYAFFWYPAVFSQAEKAGRAVRIFVDKSFWRVAGRLLIFDIFWIASLFLVSQKADSFLFFIADWIFKTLYSVLLSVYVFGSYVNGSQAENNPKQF